MNEHCTPASLPCAGNPDLQALSHQWELAKLLEPDERYNSTLSVQWECNSCTKCSNCLQSLVQANRTSQDNFTFIDGTETQLGIEYVKCDKCAHAFHLDCMYKREVIGEQSA